MTQNLFRAIDKIFCPKTEDNTAHKDPILLKKLCKGDAAWITQKVVLCWEIDTVKQVLTLPEDCKSNLISLIDTNLP